MESLSDAKYNWYDKIVAKSLEYTMSIYRDKDKIYVSDFYSENKAHMFAFNILEMTSSILHIPLYLDISLFEYWKFKRNYLTTTKIQWRWFKKGGECTVYPREILDVVGNNAMNINDDVYAEIYDEYYNSDKKNLTGWEGRD